MTDLKSAINEKCLEAAAQAYSDRCGGKDVFMQNGSTSSWVCHLASLTEAIKAYEVEKNNALKIEMKNAGMIDVDESVDNPSDISKFLFGHCGVNNLDDFIWWIKTETRQLLKLSGQMHIEKSTDKEDIELLDYVSAKAGVFQGVLINFTNATKKDEISNDTK